MVKAPKLKVIGAAALKKPEVNVNVITGGAVVEMVVVPAGVPVPAAVNVVAKPDKVPLNAALVIHPVRVMTTLPNAVTAATGVRDTVIATELAPAKGWLSWTLMVPKLLVLANNNGALTVLLAPKYMPPLAGLDMDAASPAVIAD